MARITGFECPLCGRSLVAASASFSVVGANETRVGKHVHLAVAGDFVCSLGHAWDLTDQAITLRRKA